MYTLLYIFIDMYTLLYLGCARSLLLHLGFLQLQSMGSRHMGFSGCGTGAHYLWLEGLVALQHVESSQTRDRTCVPCVGRRILTHSATREVLCFLRNCQNVFHSGCTIYIPTTNKQGLQFFYILTNTW